MWQNIPQQEKELMMLMFGSVFVVLCCFNLQYISRIKVFLLCRAHYKLLSVSPLIQQEDTHTQIVFAPDSVFTNCKRRTRFYVIDVCFFFFFKTFYKFAFWQCGFSISAPRNLKIYVEKIVQILIKFRIGYYSDLNWFW